MADLEKWKVKWFQGISLGNPQQNVYHAGYYGQALDNPDSEQTTFKVQTSYFPAVKIGDILKNGLVVGSQATPRIIKIQLKGDILHWQLQQVREFSKKDHFPIPRGSFDFGNAGFFEYCLVGEVIIRKRSYIAIFPCSEIFRAFYCSSEYVAREFFSAAVEPRDTRFFNLESGMQPENVFYINPNTCISKADMRRVLPAIYYEHQQPKPPAVQGIDMLINSFNAQHRPSNTPGQAKNFYPLRIQTRFPFDCSVKMQVRGKRVPWHDGRVALLVTNIVASEFPLPNQIKDVEYFPKNLAGTEEQGDEPMGHFPKQAAEQTGNETANHDSRPDSRIESKTHTNNNQLILLDDDLYTLSAREKPSSTYTSSQRTSGKAEGSDVSFDKGTTTEDAKGILPKTLGEPDRHDNNHQIKSAPAGINKIELLIPLLASKEITYRNICHCYPSHQNYSTLPPQEDMLVPSWSKIWYDSNNIRGRGYIRRRCYFLELFCVEKNQYIYLAEIETRMHKAAQRNPANHSLPDATSESYCVLLAYNLDRTPLAEEDQVTFLSFITENQGRFSPSSAKPYGFKIDRGKVRKRKEGNVNQGLLEKILSIYK